MSNWSELPRTLLALIAHKLMCTPDYTDYVRFGGVCVSWRSACVSWGPGFAEYQRRHLPLLMIPNKDNKQTRSLYCLIERRVLKLQLPVPHDKSCRGSTQGWLVTIDKNLAVHLLNPFSTINNEIRLPSLTSFSKIDEDDTLDLVESLFKAVLSASPTSNPNYAVIIIYGQYNRLAFSKAGDTAWTPFDFEWAVFDDVIFYKDQFYAVDHIGRVMVFDVGPPYPTVTKIIESPTDETVWRKRYLVESSGELLQLRRVVDMYDMKPCYSTVEVQVFKLDPIGSKWIELKSLLDRVIFIGDNTSMSLSALDFPGCKPNCIYCTDDYSEAYSAHPEYGPHDMGVFNLENGRFEPYYSIDDHQFDSEMIMPPPIWVEPVLLSRAD